MRQFIALILLSLSLCSFGQRKGVATYLTVDTLKGADTVYMSLPRLTGYYSVSWWLYFDEVGGTSDGTGILQAANDTSYATLNTVDPVISGVPNDTITISNGLVQYYYLYGTPAVYYRVRLIGTTGDTTRIVSNYVLK